MKDREEGKSLSIPWCYFIGLAFVSLLLLSCSHRESSPTGPGPLDPTQTARPISKTTGKLEIRIDPRVELLFIVQNIALFTQWDNPRSLSTELETYFAPFKDHPAVKTIQELMESQGLIYAKAVAFMLCHDYPPDFGRLYPLSAVVAPHMPSVSRSSEDKLIKAFRNFYVDSNFITFYETHRKEYQAEVNRIASHIGEKDFVGLLEGYFGEKKDRYIAIWRPGLGKGVLIEHDGEADAYGVFFSQDVLLHEFAHCFVNPITDDFARDVEPFYWLNVNELIIMAFTSRAHAILEGEEEGLKNLSGKERKYPYVRPIYELLRDEYEPHRDIYPDFRSFYPRILDLLAELVSAQ